MRIGELARSVDVNIETIRYYQRIGLLTLPEKPYGGMRSYGDEDLQRLRFIRRAQQLGFSLEDIRELLELSSSGRRQGRNQERSPSLLLAGVHHKKLNFRAIGAAIWWKRR